MSLVIAVLCGARAGRVIGAVDQSVKLVLVRHGRSSLVQRGWIDQSGFQQWRLAYEAAGLAHGEAPPDDLRALSARADVFVSSDAPRALASARLLSGERPILASPLLRELDLEAPALPGVRLPLRAWAVAVGCRMLWSRLTEGYPSPAEGARINEAVVWLQAQMEGAALGIVVTHASVRSQIAKQLQASGWEFDHAARTSRNWSGWSLERRITMQ